ncbi:MAG: GEVED domain-containing protein [Flavobacteriales bacterium]
MQGYCIPTYTVGTGEGDYISSVALEDISSNSAGAETPPYYEDYSFSGTSLTTRLSAGSSYTIQITSAWNAGVAAWMDYNQDGDFDDPGEQLGFSSTTSPNATVSLSFTVPSGAVHGYTALRTRVAYGATVATLQPCSQHGYGETEDYTILIENGSCATLYGFGTFDGDSISAISLASYEVYYAETDPWFNPLQPYSDLYFRCAQLVQGQSPTLNVSIGAYAPNRVNAWIDWNFDGDFDDAGEHLGEQQVNTAFGTASFNVSVPLASFLVGYTRMRVRTHYGASNTSPCASLGYGEAIDFPVSIRAGVIPCLPSTGYGTTYGDGFSQVEYQSMVTNGSTAWPYYQFASNALHAVQGQTQTMAITNSSYPDQTFAAYLDMNDDGDFSDAGESLGSVNATSAMQVLNLNFTVPPTCPPGQHALRLRAYFPSYPPASPCDDQLYGEILDFQLAVQAVGGPCIPHMSAWTTDGDFINGVSLNTLTNPNTGAALGPAYTDYTGLSTTLAVGSTHTITIEGGAYGGDLYLAYLDYNGDNDWDDAGEALGSVQIMSAYGTGTITFTVPPATPGTKRLRIRCRFASSSTACEDAVYGETEDYSVVIEVGSGLGEAAAQAALVIARPGDGVATLRAAERHLGSRFEVLDATGRRIAAGQVASTTVDMPMAAAAAGAYTLLLHGPAGVEALRFTWER